MFVVILLVKWGGKIVEKIAQIALMGWANKLAGVVLYAALYTTILSIILFFAEKIQLLQPETISASKCYWFIQPWAPKIIDGFGMVVPTLKGLFVQLDHFFSVIATKSK
jgi:membrane protein required for colicin V production